MKSGIHPTFYPDAVVTCACGNTWTTGSTKKEIHTDVCSNCHPFFTGEQRIVDTAGQVERFMKRISAKEQIAAQQPAPEEKKSKKEKRRERRAGAAAPAPTPLQPPAELPLASVSEEAPQAQNEPTPVQDTRMEEVAPAVTVDEVRPQENAIVPEAMQIGEAASIDKVIEPTEGGTAEVRDNVSDVEMPGEAAEVKKARKPRAPRKPAPSKPKEEE